MKRLLAAAILAWAAAASAADIPEALLSGYKAFLEGRYDDAAAAYRYVAALAVSSYESEADLAIVSREQGDADAALALLVKSTLHGDADGLVWDARGWAYLAEGRHKEARESFLKAIDRSSTTATQAEANLGLGLVALSRSDPNSGLEALRNALVQGPYALAAASYETALSALALGNKQAGLEYLRQGLQADPLHLESLKLLARTYERIGENRPAWRTFSRILALDPKDEEATGKVKKLAKFIVGDPEASLSVRRLSRPLLDPANKPVVEPAASTPTVRVALFSDGTGAPATLTQTYFMSNAPFRIVAASGETIKEDGRAYDQWEILFRPESNLVELRDASRNIQYTTKTPFRIVPLERLGTVLLKSAKFVELTGFDRGDRELRGVVEAQPTPFGFKAVNEVPIEDYLYGAVGAMLPQGSPAEAYKAQAVLSRTLALWYKSQAPANQERADICDSRRCQRYIGVNEEMREASRAVADTEGLVLTTKDGRLARPMEHEHCGGVTETGAAAADPSLAALTSVADGPSGGIPTSPLQLERLVHDFPARDRFCEQQSVTAASDSRWVRLLETRELQPRADRVKNIGEIKALRVLRRSATGRVQALLVQGSRDGLTLEGFDAIAEFLSPGTLRSALFTIQPLPRVSGPAQFIVWGAGTGHGLGLCRAGAIGQAALGRKYEQILGHYFPAFRLDTPKAKPAAAAKEPAGRHGYRRPLNPRYKKPGAP
jgi:stage II sporulation protein D